MKTVIIIPARYASTRLPGKPLAMIAGQTMLQRVHSIAQQAVDLAQTSNNIDILIATEDQRIVDHAESFGAMATLTPDTCQSGTDRALEAIKTLDYTPDFVVNLQGDTPLMPPDFVAEVIEAFAHNPDLQVVTPVTQLSWAELDELRAHKLETPFSGTTAILDKNDKALWFSKNIIPAMRKEQDLRQDKDTLSPVYRHLGIYGYALPVLQAFAELPPSHYEVLEGLEQLRMIENGYDIQCVKVDYKGRPSISGVDSPEDVARTEALLKNLSVA